MKTLAARLRSLTLAALSLMAAGLFLSTAPASAEDAGLQVRAAEFATAPVETSFSAYRARRYRAARGYSPGAAVAGGAYFVDFRARYALSYGHSYVAYGRLDANGRIIESHVAGLHPAGESSAPWMIGHLVFVPSETGASDGDLESKYIAASYRVTMDQARYTEMVAYIRQLQANSPLWHAVFYNCNTFAGNIARHMGLQAPTVTLIYPATYINAMRDLNGGRTSLSGSYSSLQQ